MIRITFEMPDGTAELLRLSAERISLTTGSAPPSLDDIAKALVHEVLIDDAGMHGLTPEGQRVH